MAWPSSALLTPHQVHHGLADQALRTRLAASDVAYAAHPERFGRPPLVPSLHKKVWINPPESTDPTTEAGPGASRRLTPAAAVTPPVRPLLEPSPAQ